MWVLSQCGRWEADNILVPVKAQKALPRIFIKNDYSARLHLDAHMNGEVMNLAPCELFRFNIGAFKEGCLAELVWYNQDHQTDHNWCRIDTGVDPCVLVVEPSATGDTVVKGTTPLASIVYGTKKEDGVPSIED